MPHPLTEQNRTHPHRQRCG
jgi:hypothetical protein